ncbi:MAG: hypothetical protein GY945_04540 [Rhodobacteraceae bacterium]|nr:hypothetical protein [Paracoccaceae bacterium]
MEISEIRFDGLDGAIPIDGYGPGFFRIAGQVLRGPVLVTSEAAVSWGGLEDLAALLALAGQVDVLFLGLGAEMTARPTELLNQLEAAGIGVEPMASPTACRSYNVLLADGRRIALAALPV